MSSVAIPYYDLLIRLALFQKDLDVPVQFRFQLQNTTARERALSRAYTPFDPDQPSQVLVYPILIESVALETLPLYNFPDLDPLRLWQSFGYISLVEGSLDDELGAFVLTEKTLGLDLIQSAW